MSDDVSPALVPVTPDPPSSPDAAVPLSRLRRWRLPLLCGLLGAVVGAGGVGTVWALSAHSSHPAASFTLTGTMMLNGDHVPAGNNGCQGSSGFSDLAQGAAVTVYDSAGSIVGEGMLGQGAPMSSGCQFPVVVPDVPDGAKFYQVEVTHRGKVTVSATQARAGAFAATLGP